MHYSDFSSPEFYADPYPLYRKIRAAGDLLPLAPHMSVTGRHALVGALLRDRRVGRAYLDGVRLRYGEDASRGTCFQAWSRMMLLMNPPAHTPLRAALTQAFSARRIEELQRSIREIAVDLVDSFHEHGQADIMQRFALPLPMRVICRLLDLPFADAQTFVDASRLLLNTLELAPMTPEQREAANRAAEELQAYFADVVAVRKLKPGDDLISKLLSVEIDGRRLEDEDLIANVMLLFMAGYETTANMIANALVTLHRHPEQLALLKADPGLLPSAVMECLRFDSSVQLALRVALEDIEIAGHVLPKGHIVYLLLGAANRDPEAFPDPDTFKIDRPEHELRSVSFGGGVHYCLGARLAQMEIEIALQVLLERIPSLELPDLDELRWQPRHTLRGMEELRAVWRRPAPIRDAAAAGTALDLAP